MKPSNTKKLTTLAMLAALAYLIMVVGRIPMVLFLSYDPKDVIIAIGGFIFGPLEAFIISFIVSLIEMFTVSDTGVIGAIMNLCFNLQLCVYGGHYLQEKPYAQRSGYWPAVRLAAMVVVMLLWELFTYAYLYGLSAGSGSGHAAHHIFTV